MSLAYGEHSASVGSNEMPGLSGFVPRGEHTALIADYLSFILGEYGLSSWGTWLVSYFRTSNT